MAKIISLDRLRQEKAKQNYEQPVPFVFHGEMCYVTKKVVNGGLQLFVFGKPLGEMLTSSASRRELLEKVVLDVELGRETVPLLYGPIYERREDSNFPEVFDPKWAQYGVVVFLQHVEGEEIKFGSLRAEEGPVARIVTWAAGFEYTEDMVVYNKTFDMETLNQAMGEGHNALLNHIHMSPIIGYSYTAANTTNPVYVDVEGKPTTKAETGDPETAHPILSLRETLKKGIGDSRKKKRQGNVLLVAGTRVDHVQEALESYHVRGTDYPSLGGISEVIAYDGYDIKVGKKAYSYQGVEDNVAYLIRPKKGFKELIKHGLMVDAGDGDLSRLVESQVVGRTRRGVYAAVPENVQKISLPELFD